MRKIKTILIVLMCLLLLPLNIFAITYGKVGEDTNFNGDINIPEGYKYHINGIAMEFIQCKNDGTTAPTVDDDSDDGYVVNSMWTDITNDKSYICVDATVAAAVWKEISPSDLKAASGANTDITSILNVALYIGRDADNDIDFATDNKIIFRTNAVDRMEIGTLGELDMTQNYILIDDALGTDHDYSGIVDSANVGETVVFGELLYFDWTAVEWKKAKADVVGTTPALRIALEGKGDGQACLMLVQGYIRDDSAFDFGASRVFLNDDIAGDCDDTAPAETGDQIQMVGIAISADKMFFCPSIDVGEI